MAALAYNQSEELVSFKTESLIDNSTTDFDVFLKLEDHIILYAGAGYTWNRDETHALVQEGHQEFLIRKNDLRLAQMYRQVSVIPDIDKHLPPAERIQSLEQVGFAFTKCLYEGEITPACISKAEKIAQSLADCVGEDVSCIKALSGLADHDYYTYYHSVRVATYGTAIALEMGLNSDQMLKDMAVGGIFHDIGKKHVGINIVNKTGPLTDAEWEVMRSHPTFGYKDMNNSQLPYVAQQIILHHHEKLDGSGYPHGLSKSGLLDEVQIATVADVFDALTSSRSYQRKRSRYEALDLMKHKMVGEKLPNEAFKALVSCLR